MDHTSRPPQTIYFLVLKLPLLLGGVMVNWKWYATCVLLIRILKKLPWLIEWIIRKQLFGLLFRFPGPPVSGPSPLSGFPRISKDFQGVARMDHTSRSPQPIYCWCLRLPSDSFQILIRSLSDPHQIPFRSPSDPYQIPCTFPSDPQQIPTKFLSDSYLSGFERISKDFKGVVRMDHTSRAPHPI